MKFSTSIRLALLLVGLVGAISLEKAEDDSGRVRKRRQLTTPKAHWHKSEMKNKSKAKDFIKTIHKPTTSHKPTSSPPPPRMDSKPATAHDKPAAKKGKGRIKMDHGFDMQYDSEPAVSGGDESVKGGGKGVSKNKMKRNGGW
mmetsp:Transcript_2899/g.4224  ORF Transcript_2899/g.4224 Transcript_2899/m.4224 type:complete len:143 (+) Transcript_2899:112-540(+)